MAAENSSPARVSVDGKFFRLGGEKFSVKGLTYGPFAPNAAQEMFASREQTARDFAQIRELGANLLRVYYVPPRWFLDLASQHGLKVFIDVPWQKHLCFLETKKSREEARDSVRQAVLAGGGHPAIFAYSVVNEIPAEIVRWSGARRVEEFIDGLVDVAKAADPDCLCTFTSFPPTEYLRPKSIDFVCFNVYLHSPKPYELYLDRLQMLADAKPLMLGEFGLDSIREGEAHKSEILAWQIELAFRAGLAGIVVFSYTDDWFRGGQQIIDWAFGLTTRDRQPKESFLAVQRIYRQAPYFPLTQYPRVSVVVASYNGEKTLKACLDSLSHLNYPDYEVILVDDGSTDGTPQITQLYPRVRCIRQPNRGLSVARNTGIAAATGQVVAYTDSDCRADPDWLYYMVSDLVRMSCVGVGGHNFLPPEDSCVAAAVMVSPGGPAHVMITDREAEHLPGCNMAFYKWALEEIGGFDPVFRKAGDDVDVCWRLLERGYKIGFSSAGFVWHYRRSAIRAYLKQQAGYGEAEAMLARKHPECFNSLGGGIWRGRIYTASRSSVFLSKPIVYHGLFGSGFFQKLYTPEPAYLLMFCTSLEYHGLVSLPLFLLALSFHFLWPIALVSLAISLGVCLLAGAQAELPRKQTRFWSRPLVALLFLLQPVVRGWARYRWGLNQRSQPHPFSQPQVAAASLQEWEGLDQVCYWSEQGADRYAFLDQILAKLEEQRWQIKTDTGWTTHDVEIFGNRWSRLRVVTASEELEQGRKIFRCRLETNWSLRAKLTFCLALGLELFVIGLFATAQPWLWMLLLTLPLLGWYLEHEKRSMQLLIARLLDQVATQMQMVKLRYRAQDQTLVRAGT